MRFGPLGRKSERPGRRGPDENELARAIPAEHRAHEQSGMTRAPATHSILVQLKAGGKKDGAKTVPKQCIRLANYLKHSRIHYELPKTL